MCILIGLLSLLKLLRPRLNDFSRAGHHEDKLTTYPTQIAQFRFYFQVTIVQNQWDRFVGRLNPNSRLSIVNREWYIQT